MKKILLISLVTVLAVSLVGCNGNNNDVEVNNPDVNPGISGEMNNNENLNEDNEAENIPESGNEVENDTTEGTESSGESVENNEPENNEEQELVKPNEPENNEEQETVQPNEPENNEEQQPEEPEFNENEPNFEEENEEPIVMSELEEKINTLAQNSGVQVRMPMAMPIEAETALTYIGLTEAQFNANVKDAVAFESMIMPSNFSLCLIELNDGVNVADIKKSVIDNCDLNKWICAWAEKAIVVDSGNYIMLVMSTADDCDALQKAFSTEFGATGEVLSKVNDNM